LFKHLAVQVRDAFALLRSSGLTPPMSPSIRQDSRRKPASTNHFPGHRREPLLPAIPDPKGCLPMVANELVVTLVQ
jgi:hypothetical protein